MTNNDWLYVDELWTPGEAKQHLETLRRMKLEASEQYMLHRANDSLTIDEARAEYFHYEEQVEKCKRLIYSRI